MRLSTQYKLSPNLHKTTFPNHEPHQKSFHLTKVHKISKKHQITLKNIKKPPKIIKNLPDLTPHLLENDTGMKSQSTKRVKTKNTILLINETPSTSKVHQKYTKSTSTYL
jgi:hypothetical protein